VGEHASLSSRITTATRVGMLGAFVADEAGLAVSPIASSALAVTQAASARVRCMGDIVADFDRRHLLEREGT